MLEARIGPSADDRPIDRIDTRPRFTADQADALERLFTGIDAEAMLRSVISGRLAGDVAVVSSFGAESAVLLHLVAAVDPTLPVLFLQTGKHFPETLAYRDALVARLGLADVRDLVPDDHDLAARDVSGLRWSYDPDGCCEIRKVLPLARAIVGFDATITGRKAFQAVTRTALPRFEIDRGDTTARLKINPLSDWTRADIDAYAAAHDLPAHPLVALGYPSIGCSPCTSVVAPGENPRSGRWRGWDKTECGIHAPGTPIAPPGALPPGYDPVF